MDSHPLIYREESAKGTGFEFQKGMLQRWRLKNKQRHQQRGSSDSHGNGHRRNRSRHGACSQGSKVDAVFAVFHSSLSLLLLFEILGVVNTASPNAQWHHTHAP